MTPVLSNAPLHPNFGVEIFDLDLTAVARGDGFPAIRDAFEQHSLLLFRNQSLTDTDHLALGRLFGPIEDRYPERREVGDDVMVSQVSNVLEDGSLPDENDLHVLNLKSNQLWHTDSTFLPVPALVNIIAARVVTETGGETELVSTRAAWADMPEPLKARAKHARLWHRYSHSRARISDELAKLAMFNKWPDQCWPAVLTNPVNGKEALYLASHAFAVEGLDEAAGAALIDELIEFCSAPRYIYTHDWAVGDVLIWDERATMHRGRPWLYDQPRTLSSICVSMTKADGLRAMAN